MALDTVVDYINEARVLMQDATVPYRTPDTEIKSALGLGILEIRRIRPDMFVFTALPDINSGTSNATAVPLEHQFRLALLYYVVGHVGLKDEEEGAEARASGFMRAFNVKMLAVAG